jgi:hypothetical protein
MSVSGDVTGLSGSVLAEGEEYSAGANAEQCVPHMPQEWLAPLHGLLPWWACSLPELSLCVADV